MTRKRSLVSHALSGFVVIAVLFALLPSASAQTETVLHSFNRHDGANPFANLIFDRSGRLYGTTLTGGIQNGGCTRGCGVVFQLTPNSNGGWDENVIHFFHAFFRFSPEDGAGPTAGLLFDGRGNLFGTTAGGIGSGNAFEVSHTTAGWNERLIHSFPFGGNNDGSLPWGGLILDATGNLYGTTRAGGSPTSGSGSIFEIMRSSLGLTEKVLYAFTGGEDGAWPQGSLTFDVAGNLYGTTVMGGDVSRCLGFSLGCGVVFELSPTSAGGWQESVLHTFSGGADGASSQSNLIFDGSGNLYGTTQNGGDLSDAACQPQGCGVAFKLSRNSGGDWEETVLHTFTSAADGTYPRSGLTFDSAGNLYGTTFQGGNLSVCGVGCGVVYELSPNTDGTWTETVLHKFGVLGHDGTLPVGGVILDASGNIYGTTTMGGDDNQGTVFKISR